MHSTDLDNICVPQGIFVNNLQMLRLIQAFDSVFAESLQRAEMMLRSASGPERHSIENTLLLHPTIFYQLIHNKAYDQIVGCVEVARQWHSAAKEFQRQRAIVTELALAKSAKKAISLGSETVCIAYALG